MDVHIKESEKTQKEIVFTLTPHDMEPFLNAAAHRLQRGMKIKGFREGAIPRNIVEKQVGTTALWQESSFDAIEKTYWKAMKQYEIQAIGKPRIDILKLVPGNDFEFRAVVAIMPQFALPDYKAISRRVIEKETKDTAVGDKEVDDVLSWLQRARGKAAQKKKAANAKEAALPELNDAFARSVGNFQNLAALRQSIRDGLLEEKREKEKQRLRLCIMQEIARSTAVPLADSLIEAELDIMEHEFEQRVSELSNSLEEYLKKIGKSFGELRKSWREKAEERIITRLLLRAIAEKERVEVASKEIETEANEYLRRFHNVKEAQQKIDPEELRGYIRGIIQNEKVFQLLEEKIINNH